MCSSVWFLYVFIWSPVWLLIHGWTENRKARKWKSFKILLSLCSIFIDIAKKYQDLPPQQFWSTGKGALQLPPHQFPPPPRPLPTPHSTHPHPSLVPTCSTSTMWSWRLSEIIRKVWEVQVDLPIYQTEKQESSKVLVCLKLVSAGRYKSHLPSSAAFG